MPQLTAEQRSAQVEAARVSNAAFMANKGVNQVPGTVTSPPANTFEVGGKTYRPHTPEELAAVQRGAAAVATNQTALARKPAALPELTPQQLLEQNTLDRSSETYQQAIERVNAQNSAAKRQEIAALGAPLGARSSDADIMEALPYTAGSNIVRTPTGWGAIPVQPTQTSGLTSAAPVVPSPAAPALSGTPVLRRPWANTPTENPLEQPGALIPMSTAQRTTAALARVPRGLVGVGETLPGSAALPVPRQGLTVNRLARIPYLPPEPTLPGGVAARTSIFSASGEPIRESVSPLTEEQRRMVFSQTRAEPKEKTTRKFDLRTKRKFDLRTKRWMERGKNGEWVPVKGKK